MALTGLTKELLEAAGDLPKVLDLAAAALATHVGDSGLVRLVSVDGEHLDTVTVHHPDPDVATFLFEMLSGADQRVTEGLSGRVLRSREPLVLLDMPPEAVLAMALPAHRPYLHRVGISSIVVHPIFVEGEYLGYVGCSRDRGSSVYSAEDLALAEEISARVALAVGQARGSQVRRRRSREQRAQLELAEVALAPGDVDDLYRAGAAAVADALGGDWVHVYEVDGDRLVVRADAGADQGPPVVDLERSAYARTVLGSPSPVVVHDLGTASGVGPTQHARTLGVHSGLAVAIRTPDGPLGVVATHQRSPRRYAVEERDFLQSVAATLAGGLVRRRVDADLAYRAHHDPLTGLANRALMLDRLEHALARGGRGGGTTAVMFCDLDGFKAVNDALGHAAGDEVLRQAAARIARALRPGDTAARPGGDEFVLVCEDLSDAADALGVAERIRTTLAERFTAMATAVDLTTSVGVAVAAGDDDAERLVRDADAAMYRSKTLGGNRVELFDDDVRGEVLSRLALRRDLAVALGDGDLAVAHQPVVDLRSGRVVGTEALARWHHPVRGVVPPALFVAAAEGTSLMDRLGEQVLRAACREARQGVLEELGLRLSVNVSPQQLQDTAAFVGLVRSALDDSGLPAARLCLEVTETVSVSAAARGTMLAVAGLGVRWSLDDFGTGYASLAAALDLPLAQVKLDRSLVAGSAVGSAGARRRDVLEAVVRLSAACGYECVAEGVETVEELDLVRAAGCTHAQGFRLARPVEAGALDDVVRRLDPDGPA